MYQRIVYFGMKTSSCYKSLSLTLIKNKQTVMEIKLTPQESEEYFYNALCNGLGYVTSGYGLSLDFSDDDFNEAKTKLGKESPGIFLSFEDVLMEMLRMGKTLTLLDDEGEGDNDATISLKEVHERMSNTPSRHIIDMMNENDDAETADVFIQQVFLMK
jgi:hypothetical protein